MTLFLAVSPSVFLRAHSRHSRFLLFPLVASLHLSAQAPLLQDGATILRQARLDWTLGQTLLPPSSLPSFELGLGGSGSDGTYTPLVGGEGQGHGTAGWGLGLQGRYVRGGWSVSATVLTLRNQGHTSGILQRAALAYEAESGWRLALEQTPFAWGSGLNGGDLLGDAARPFPRLSVATPSVTLPLGRWRLETFAGQLEESHPIPTWITGTDTRLAARTAGLDLHQPSLWGGLVRASFGTLLEGSLGALTMTGGHDELGQPAPGGSARSEALAELRLRLPTLAQVLRARGASVWVSRCGAPDDRAWTLVPARDLGGLQLAWDGWDLALEYAGAAAQGPQSSLVQPTYLAGFSTRGDPLGPAFGRDVATRTVELGLPLLLDGQGRLKAVRATAAAGSPSGLGSWFFQGDAQWRTPTGRVGASLASRRDEALGSEARWGWAFSLFQAVRVF